MSSCLMTLVSWLGVSGADNQSVQLLEYPYADNQRVWCLVRIAGVSSCLRISAPGLEESGADNQHVQCMVRRVQGSCSLMGVWSVQLLGRACADNWSKPGSETAGENLHP